MGKKTTETATVSATVTARLPRLPRAPKAKVNDCGCGCSGKTARRFCPGHDAILHGWVIRVERGVVAEAPAPHTEAVRAAIAAKNAVKEFAA